MRRPLGPARRRPRVIRLAVGDQVWEVWYDPWRGCPPPILYPQCACDHCGPCVQYLQEVKNVKKPTAVAAPQGGTISRVEPPKLLSKLPQVAELLVQPAWEEGDPKGERGVFVFVSSTLVKLLVKVEHPPLKLLVSGRSWDEAWAALEAILRQDDVPWEQDDGPRDRGRKKSK